ncbi:unnamed protein product [Linum tenue]|uniref:Tail-anchored protein insertion receptor WRB n=1 Tax=Linum tenue TaxID=586396 RepID=A0AAV0PVL9_9ROSI|nr:unnamed protein product [Linum tenue]CAI0474203.1 unnamed protein product [Linum tenue]
MEGDEAPLQRQRSIVAPLIFSIVVLFQLASRRLELLKRNASKSEKEVQLRAEIKRLYKEASTFSQPSTFAQAAKLRRLAAAKEKELTNYQESQGKEVKMSYDLYLKILFLLKVIAYFLFICWYWRAPVAVVSQQLVQPFGKLLSWTAGDHLTNNVTVGVIPWLILSTRVSKFVARILK